MTRQHSAGLLVLHAHFYTFASTGECRIDIIITITVAVAVAMATTTVAIACQRCTCRFCSLLCWHCILLGRFDNSFYLRRRRRRRCRTSLVCLSFTLPHSCLTPSTSPRHSTLGMWKSLSSILNGAAVFFLSNGGISATTTAFHKLTVCIRCPPRSFSLSLFSFSHFLPSRLAPKLTSISVRFYYFPSSFSQRPRSNL